MDKEKNKKKSKKLITTMLIIILIFLIFALAFFITKLRIEESFKNEFKNNEKGETKTFSNNDEGIDNSSIFKMFELKKIAYDEGMQKHYYGFLKIPSVNIEEKIFKGANKYTLALGVATDFYEDAVPGKGNFVLAGHNFGIKDVLLSNLNDVKIGETIEVIIGSETYRYKVTQKAKTPDDVIVKQGKIEEYSLFKYPEIGEKPLITIYTCEPFGITNKRIVVQGELID